MVSAGTSDPSSTRLLADRTAERAGALAPRRGHTVTVSVIDLREIAADISTALISQLITPKLQQAVTRPRRADGIIAAAPVYKAGPSGLFTSFFQVLDNDLLIAKPVVLAATAGTARHALVADDQMRPLFAYLRAMTVPTSLFAAPEDWGDPALDKRIDRAAFELVLLMESGFAAQDQGRVLAELPARVRQRRRHRTRHRPRHRPHAPGHRRLRRLTRRQPGRPVVPPLAGKAAHRPSPSPTPAARVAARPPAGGPRPHGRPPPHSGSPASSRARAWSMRSNMSSKVGVLDQSSHGIVIDMTTPDDRAGRGADGQVIRRPAGPLGQGLGNAEIERANSFMARARISGTVMVRAVVSPSRSRSAWV